MVVLLVVLDICCAVVGRCADAFEDVGPFASVAAVIAIVEAPHLNLPP